MRVAVLTLTRDRLDYTKHCFQRLQDLAGCEYDHYVLDQASEDGTGWWLEQWMLGAKHIRRTIFHAPQNVGVSCGINRLLDISKQFGAYDVIAKFDNDCELVVPDTLKVACEVAMTGEWIVSPHIQGLMEPPPVQQETEVLGYRIGVPPLIGGIFMAAPGWVFDSYRHAETNPLWGMDDVNLCGWWKARGHQIGYLTDYPAFHYETTQGQRERYPDYFVRKDAERAA